ncbi:MAG TPA: PKD domain-containing protein, partial [Blastocatellia bacterium]|nr:PKD domain-containing protein [Blastocatellia bacterium]
SITLTATVSGPSASQTSASWTFSDDWTTAPASFGQTSISHTFARSGVFPVSISATDAQGTMATATLPVTVREPADSCSTPLVIPGAGPFPYSVSMSNETATAQFSDPAPPCVPQGLGNAKSLWVEFTPQTSDQYEFTTCGSAVDTVLSAWTGPACGPYVQVANGCNHTAGSGASCDQTRTSDMVVQATAGVPVRIMVAGYSSIDIGVITLTVDLFSHANAPVITGASISRKDLIVSGIRFSQGAVIELNGADQRTQEDPLNPSTSLIGRKSGKKIPSGTMVTLQVRNANGLRSNSFPFSRP